MAKTADRVGGKKFHGGQSWIFIQSQGEKSLSKEFWYTINGAPLTWHINAASDICMSVQYFCSIFFCSMELDSLRIKL